MLVHAYLDEIAKIERIFPKGVYTSLGGPFAYDEIDPIPINAEILEKNGFEKCNEDTDGAIQYEFGNEISGVDVWVNTKPCLFGSWRTWPDAACSYSMVEELPINYVHELQHTLGICGIEKEIVL